MIDDKAIVLNSSIEEKILMIRGQRVMLDADLALLYGVTTKQLNQQVKRNMDRFPADFMFRLGLEERQELVTICDRFKNLKHSASLPVAFTEHGAIMLANVLRSKRAVRMSIYIVRAFTKLRDAISKNADLAQKISELEGRISTHDKAIQSIFAAIRALMSPQKFAHKKIGFELKNKFRASDL